MSLAGIVGQEHATRLARSWLQSGRLPHTVLIAGPPGVGKRDLAVELVKAILCGSPGADACDACPACQRVAAGTHPDVHLVVPLAGAKAGNDETALEASWRLAAAAYLAGDVAVSSSAANISRESLRLLQRQMAYAPTHGTRRLALIMDAERMHPAGANALLKTLEEPPAKSIFILVSSAPEQIVATIRSRCQRLNLGRLPPAAVRQVLASEGVGPERVEIGVQFGGGNLHRARAAARGDLDLAWQRVERFLQGAVSGTDAAYWELVSELGARDARGDLELFLELAGICLRDVFFALAGWPSGRALLDQGETVERLARSLTAAQTQRAALELDAAAEMLTRNVGPGILLAELWCCLRGERAANRGPRAVVAGGAPALAAPVA